MLLTTLRDQVLTLSGHLYLNSLAILGISDSQFITIVRYVLSIYNQYHFYTTRVSIPLTNGKFIFSRDNDLKLPPPIAVDILTRGVQYSYHKPCLTVIGAVDHVVADCQMHYLLSKTSNKTRQNTVPEVRGIPDIIGWDAMSRVPSLEDYKVVSNVTKTKPKTDTLEDWEILGLDTTESIDRSRDIVGDDPDTHLFIDLVTARFMIIVGRSTGMITGDDLPADINWSELKADGENLWEQSMESIQESADFTLGILDSPF